MKDYNKGLLGLTILSPQNLYSVPRVSVQKFL